jgi:hypothetical protein
MNNIEFYRFGPLLGKTTINEELRLELLETGIIQTIDARKHLAGHIENEKKYSIELIKKFEPKIMEYIDDYIQSASNEKNLVKSKYKSILNSLWINRQIESEHNPPHYHRGGQISFVIYLDFPKEIQMEKPLYKDLYPGSIQFLYGLTNDIDTDYNINTFIKKILSPNDNITHIPATGEMFIFPSYLMHYVSPFYTKGIERISVSGNISIVDIKTPTNSLI